MLNLTTAERPGLGRYIGCLIYECLLVLAWVFVLAVLFLPMDAWLNPGTPKGQLHIPTGLNRLLQLLWYGSGMLAYFVFFWTRKGQTLAMKTWKIRLVSLDGSAVRPLQAVVRFSVALMAIPLFGLAWLWAFGSPLRLSLHDQLSKTVLVRAL